MYEISYTMCYIVYNVLYNVLMQDGLVPPLDPEEAAGIITGSEHILKDYARKASLKSKDIKALIEVVLHNPNFNADDVDSTRY